MDVKSPETLVNHFHHFKVNRLLQTSLAKAKVFQSLQRKPEHFREDFLLKNASPPLSPATPLICAVPQLNPLLPF